MCNVGAIGLGIQGAGVIGNYMAARQEKSAYSRYYSLQSQATLDNYIQQQRAIKNRYIEEEQATTAHKQEIYIENLQAKATAQASAATSGIEGISIENLFRGYDRATALSNYTAAKNLQMKGLQYNDELDSLRVQAINSINLQTQYTGASPMSTLLGGLGGLLSTYSREYKGKNNWFSYTNRKTGTREHGILMSGGEITTRGIG